MIRLFFFFFLFACLVFSNKQVKLNNLFKCKIKRLFTYKKKLRERESLFEICLLLIIDLSSTIYLYL